MSDWTSNLIIDISIVIGILILKFLPKKIKWGWRLDIVLVSIIILSTVGHLLAKLLS